MERETKVIFLSHNLGGDKGKQLVENLADGLSGSGPGYIKFFFY
jgi:hypothetical protein